MDILFCWLFETNFSWVEFWRFYARLFLSHLATVAFYCMNIRIESSNILVAIITHDTASMVIVSFRLTASVSSALTNPRSSIFWILVSGQVVTNLIPSKLRSDTDVNLYYLANSNISICLSHAQSWIESDGSAFVTYDFFINSPDLIIWRVGSVMFITFPWIVI